MGHCLLMPGLGVSNRPVSLLFSGEQSSQRFSAQSMGSFGFLLLASLPQSCPRSCLCNAADGGSKTSAEPEVPCCRAQSSGQAPPGDAVSSAGKDVDVASRDRVAVVGVGRGRTGRPWRSFPTFSMTL